MQIIRKKLMIKNLKDTQNLKENHKKCLKSNIMKEHLQNKIVDSIRVETQLIQTNIAAKVYSIFKKKMRLKIKV